MLSEALRNNESLLYLDLSVNKLDDKDMECLGMALKYNRKLQFLDMRSNRITDRGVSVFTSIALDPTHHHQPQQKHNSAHSSRTSSADVQSTSSTSPEAQAFCPRNNRVANGGLRKLWLQDNPIGESGAKVIRDALKVNFHLEYVGFSEYFGDGVSSEMEYYMALNWGGRRLLSRNQNLRMSGQMCKSATVKSHMIGNELLWPLVLERANNCAAMDRTTDILFCLLRGNPTVLSNR